MKIELKLKNSSYSSYEKETFSIVLDKHNDFVITLPDNTVIEVDSSELKRAINALLVEE